MDARARMAEAGTTPVLIKIAPDLTLSELDDIVGAARRHRVDGMIIGNTTLTSADAARGVDGRGGGRIGAPALSLATRMLAESWRGSRAHSRQWRRRHRFRRSRH
jgi:dihydroorotate dehydrogenase